MVIWGKQVECISESEKFTAVEDKSWLTPLYLVSYSFADEKKYHISILMAEGIQQVYEIGMFNRRMIYVKDKNNE